MIRVETRKNVVLPPLGDKHERNLRLAAWNEREKEREREREREREEGEIHIFRVSTAFESNGDLEIRREYRIGIIINIDRARLIDSRSLHN